MQSTADLPPANSQKAFILKQGDDGIPVADICRKAGISQATYFNWKKRYDGLLPTEMRRLNMPTSYRHAGTRRHEHRTVTWTQRNRVVWSTMTPRSASMAARSR